MSLFKPVQVLIHIFITTTVLCSNRNTHKVQDGSVINPHYYRFSSRFRVSSSSQTRTSTNPDMKVKGGQLQVIAGATITIQIFNPTPLLSPLNHIFWRYWAIPIHTSNLSP